MYGCWYAAVTLFGCEYHLNHIDHEIRIHSGDSRRTSRLKRWQRDSHSRILKAWAAEQIAQLGPDYLMWHAATYAADAEYLSEQAAP